MFSGMPSALTEDTVMFVVGSVIPRGVELCSAIWDPFGLLWVLCLKLVARSLKLYSGTSSEAW